jgi:hypothetical protein
MFIMKLLWTILLTLILFSFTGTGVKESHTLNIDNLHCKIQTIDGRISGKYISYHPNGKKKAEGHILNNYRAGVWQIWDANGKKLTSRTYITPFKIKQVIGKKGANLSEGSVYELTRNGDGCYDYFPINESMVVMSTRLWRQLNPELNPLLFRSNSLLKIILEAIKNGDISTYADESLLKAISPSDIDTTNLRVTAYRLYEDYVYDRVRNISEFRIISIAPIFENIKTKESGELFWLYFPFLRKHLATHKIEGTKMPKGIENMDDIFFLRYFSGDIYKEANLHDVEMDYEPNYTKRRQRSLLVDAKLIEAEHDLWIK